mgnify:CR=1 FL=1
MGAAAGAVAAALVTGKRGLISNETNDVLRAAGLFELSHVKRFTIDLFFPLERQLLNWPAMQRILLAQVDDLPRGYISMSALVLWLEVVGSLAALRAAPRMGVDPETRLWTPDDMALGSRAALRAVALAS